MEIAGRKTRRERETEERESSCWFSLEDTVRISGLYSSRHHRRHQAPRRRLSFSHLSTVSRLPLSSPSYHLLFQEIEQRTRVVGSIGLSDAYWAQLAHWVSNSLIGPARPNKSIGLSIAA